MVEQFLARRKKRGFVFFLLFILASGITSAGLTSDGLNIVDDQNNIVVDISKNGTISIDPQAMMGSSTSVGGAINLDNTKNKGVGMALYTNAGSGILGKLLSVRCDNALFDEDCIHVSNDGKNSGISLTSSNGPGLTIWSSTTTPKSHALSTILSTQADDASALSVNSMNKKHSAMQITGTESGRGSLKISHVKPSGVSDSSASAISIDLQGAGTAAQGLFIDATSGTIGKLLNIRNKGQEKLVLQADGSLHLTGDLLIKGNLVVDGCIIYKISGVQQVIGTCI